MRYQIAIIPHPQYGNQHLPMVVDSLEFNLPQPSAAIWGWELWLSSPFNTAKNRLSDLCVSFEFVERELPTFFEDAAKLNFWRRISISNWAKGLSRGHSRICCARIFNRGVIWHAIIRLHVEVWPRRFRQLRVLSQELISHVLSHCSFKACWSKAELTLEGKS